MSGEFGGQVTDTETQLYPDWQGVDGNRQSFWPQGIFPGGDVGEGVGVLVGVGVRVGVGVVQQ